MMLITVTRVILDNIAFSYKITQNIFQRKEKTKQCHKPSPKPTASTTTTTTTTTTTSLDRDIPIAVRKYAGQDR